MTIYQLAFEDRVSGLTPFIRGMIVRGSVAIDASSMNTIG
jgi:hypothetical protein